MAGKRLKQEQKRQYRVLDPVDLTWKVSCECRDRFVSCYWYHLNAETDLLAAIDITLMRLYCLWANPADLLQLTKKSITYFCKWFIHSKFLFLFMFPECLVLVGEVREFWEVLARANFLFLSRVLCLFVVARSDEMLSEADLCWTAWLQRVRTVKTQANEEDPYEMLVQVPPAWTSQEIWTESWISESEKHDVLTYFQLFQQRWLVMKL